MVIPYQRRRQQQHANGAGAGRFFGAFLCPNKGTPAGFAAFAVIRARGLPKNLKMAAAPAICARRDG